VTSYAESEKRRASAASSRGAPARRGRRHQPDYRPAVARDHDFLAARGPLDEFRESCAYCGDPDALHAISLWTDNTRRYTTAARKDNAAARQTLRPGDVGSVKLTSFAEVGVDTINIHQAKTHLSRLVEDVAAGAEIVIAKNGVPRARLVPLGRTRPLKFGVLKGKLRYPDDFDAPLPDAVQARFEGRRGK
jgi:prevent-host-death family protein